MKIRKNDLTVSFSPKNRKYEINYKGFSWVNEGRPPYIIIRHKIGRNYAHTIRTFGCALEKQFSCVDNRITARYSGFWAFGRRLPFTLVCMAEITDRNTVVFSIKAENESEMDISAVYFPGPFDAKQKGGSTYAVDTMRQGFLMPDGYKNNFLSTIGFANYPRRINTGDCYLPFWGRVSGNNGFCAIVETPFDAAMFSCFGKNLSFLNSFHWYSSLGRLNYERKIRFVFHDKCDYNTLAKDYRAYVAEQGRLVTLQDKIAQNENVKNIIGAPVLHCRTFSNVHPKSGFYQKDGENRKLFASFEKRAQQYQALKAAGLKQLYIHTDGWGEQGYDNNHPYILPPCPEAGGYEGMKRLSETCRKLGYVFAIHDQYRDFYYTGKKFDIQKAVTKIDGTHFYCDYWDGGPHTWLCASQAPEFVETTYKALAEHGVDIQGAYLDVFSIVAGDECFHPNHRITREESIRFRGQCFDLLTKRGIIPSSEEPGDFLLDKLALVHHGPYMLRPQERGQAVGIPVPILSLVYHDCIMIPWLSKGTGGWGIPNGDSAKLHCILNAGMPYFDPLDDHDDLIPSEALEKEIARVQQLACIQAKLFDCEMIQHRFLDHSLRRQQAVYSDGTVITVDFERNTYSIRRVEQN